MRVFLNLCFGLDRLGIKYRVNDYKYIKRHQNEIACIVGKPYVLNKIDWKNPILFGASIYAHSCDDPYLLKRLPVKLVLVPGEWMRKMCEPDWGDKVVSWPVGIDTKTWAPTFLNKDIDILLYDKVRWHHDEYEKSLINPIISDLRRRRLSVHIIRYGFYREDDFQKALARTKAMIFLCEHETQGIAYQQALSCGVPILAWDRKGFWQDPEFFPHRVKFAPVTSVPYWDERCGIKFVGIDDFVSAMDYFWPRVINGEFNPREYILENLTLEKSARSYLNYVEKIQKGLD